MGQGIIKIKNHINAAIKKAVYKIIFGKHLKFGSGVTFRKGFSICIEEQGHIKIGSQCFFNNNCSVNSLAGVTIGDNCIFGENVYIYDHNHRFADARVPIKDQGYSTGEIEIGDDCWVGSNCVILKGVKIGSHCVIGANCTVYKDVPDNTVLKCSQTLIAEPICRR